MFVFARPLAVLWAALVLFVAGPHPVAAQSIDVPVQVRELSPPERLSGAVHHLDAGRPSEAVRLLRPLVKTHPGYRNARYGAAAYWLGVALDTTGQSKPARTVRADGIRALDTAGQFDVRLAEAYLHDLTPKTLPAQRGLAVRVYEHLLQHVGPDANANAQAIFRRELAQLAPLLPDEVFPRVVDAERSADPTTWTFHDDAGSVLSGWWRSLDPMPSTSENERMEEHLTRRVHARQHYACADRLGGLDDRGVAYLRLGAPWKTNEIRYNDMDFLQEVFRFGVPVSGFDFPPARLWLYTHIDQDGYFLFAENHDGCFEIARANDLLPSRLRMYRASSERGLNIAYSSMMAMRYIYRELALYHPDFSNRYNEVAEYASLQEMRAAQAEAAIATGRPEMRKDPGERQTIVGSGATQRIITYNPVFGERPPTEVVNQVVQEAARADRAAAKRREEALPSQRTALRDDIPSLPVAVRTARFLTPDGATTTEITWGVRATDVALDEDEATPSLITFSAVRYDPLYRRQNTVRRRIQIPALRSSDKSALVPTPVTLGPTTDVEHVAFQWNHYPLYGTGRNATPGRRHHATVARTDSLAPLRASGPLEMSDLRVLTTPDTTEDVPTQIEQAVPYPFSGIRPTTPLLLGFELYHLASDADDRTRYTVTYEVEGQTRRTWTRPFRKRDVQWTSTATTATGTSARTEEIILLDLSRLGPDGTQDVRVTVRVTDEVTGATARRSVNFTLRP